MGIIKRALKQTCTVWQLDVASTGTFGNKKVVRTTGVKCRWEDKQELFIDSEGEERTSLAVVMMDIDVPEGSYMYLGTPLEASTVHPSTIKGAVKVRSFEKTPNFKVTEFLRIARG